MAIGEKILADKYNSIYYKIKKVLVLMLDWMI